MGTHNKLIQEHQKERDASADNLQKKDLEGAARSIQTGCGKGFHCIVGYIDQSKDLV